jgi:hypothetical protein
MLVGGEEESRENEQEYGGEDYRRTEGFSHGAKGYGSIVRSVERVWVAVWACFPLVAQCAYT